MKMNKKSYIETSKRENYYMFLIFSPKLKISDILLCFFYTSQKSHIFFLLSISYK